MSAGYHAGKANAASRVLERRIAGLTGAACVHEAISKSAVQGMYSLLQALLPDMPTGGILMRCRDNSNTCLNSLDDYWLPWNATQRDYRGTRWMWCLSFFLWNNKISDNTVFSSIISNLLQAVGCRIEVVTLSSSGSTVKPGGLHHILVQLSWVAGHLVFEEESDRRKFVPKWELFAGHAYTEYYLLSSTSEIEWGRGSFIFLTNDSFRGRSTVCQWRKDFPSSARLGWWRWWLIRIHGSLES